MLNLQTQRIVHSQFTPLASNSLNSLSSQRKAPVIGIIGGIGSGKSSVARGLQARRQLGLIDADILGHQALEDSNNQIQIREAFGDRVFSNPTSVDRSTLASLVFGEHESQIENREVLEQIVHPWINTRIEAEIEKHRCDGKAAILLDAAVLLESGWRDECHSIAFIDTPEPIRQQRVQHRGWSSDELERRESSQLSLQKKKSLSDIIINNGGALESAIDELEAHLNQLLKAPT